jgi:hypothetical protein
LVFSFDFVKLLNLLDDMDLLDSFGNGSVWPLMDLDAQDQWYDYSFTGTWRSRIKAPIRTIVTKWGFCYSFNMMLRSDLLHLER